MSDSKERPSYKFQRLREAIRNAIKSGDLKHKLPGERELARRFGVNAKTISKALTDLTTEGLLVRRIGRGTFVVGQDSPDRLVGTARRYLWLASSQLRSCYVDCMFEMARTRLQAQGHRISLEIAKPDESGELPERCVQIGSFKGLAGIVVFSSVPSRAFLADLSRRHLPVVLCNARSLSIKTDAVIADYALGTFELTEHLVQLGHKKIQLVLDKQATWASARAQRGYHTAMGRYQLQPLPALPCLAQDVARVLEASAEFSAVVCVAGGSAAAIREQLSQKGRHIPGDVSLVAMAQPGQLADQQQQSITGYDVYPDHIVDWAIHLLFGHGPGQTPREVIVPGVFNDRGSTRSLSRLPPEPQDQHIVL